jgi:hypothetical protein
LTYRSQRGITRLEDVVVTNRKLLPGRVAEHLEVRLNDTQLAEPSLCIVRLVNTGDTPIRTEDYESDLVITLQGVETIASAIWTGARPPDLRPEIRVDDNRVSITPTLVNPEDMLELQVLAAGQAEDKDSP